MEPLRPRTYNELLCYTRCRDFVNILGSADKELFERVYTFVREDTKHRIVAEAGNLHFYHTDEDVQTEPIIFNGLYSRMILTATILSRTLPVSYTDSGSSYTSSNNNNNNNNNNA